jgi:glyoxylase-like metal-dependent hydrolase (beta-lactamase superfamily II)
MQIPLSTAAAVGDDQGHGVLEIAPDLAYKRLAIVNVAFYGAPGGADGSWTLVDAGLPGTASTIISAAKGRFSGEGRPAAIVMTHGHFDHVGALVTLAEQWQVPIYAHPLELSYLDGRRSYEPPDPKVGGGMMSLMSPLFPLGPIDVSRWLTALPEDGSVPTMPGWRWLHTPGHAPGHVSLWRISDRSLLAGDAFITTKQESAYAAAMQTVEMHGPPMYFTPDWISAKRSVEALAQLEPERAVTGHGRAVAGEALKISLHALADRFDEVAVPDHGRYVPVRHDNGERKIE